MTAKEFLEGLPGKVNTETLIGMETLFHFDLEGEGGAQMTLQVKDGSLTAVEGFEGEPRCTVKAKASDFIDVATGKLNPMMAVLTGKLKMTNQGEMIKYAKIFGLM